MVREAEQMTNEDKRAKERARGEEPIREAFQCRVDADKDSDERRSRERETLGDLDFGLRVAELQVGDEVDFFFWGFPRQIQMPTKTASTGEVERGATVEGFGFQIDCGRTEGGR
ncbi:unnamed protein product [Linum tenue]|uniref:Uncharacterized protein n=1 Tax=Linum tenue TaxID=586396 RepID=A0AAV0ISI5_9ROSI|nr:unnamed protein product [Linum tenue]